MDPRIAQPMRRALWIASLLVLASPAASAALVWDIQETEAWAGDPVPATYRIMEDGVLVGHVNVHLRVLLDDTILMDTPFVHEHDGVHTLAVSPPRAGILRFEATPAGGDPIVATLAVGDSAPEGAHEGADITLGENEATAVPGAGTEAMRLEAVDTNGVLRLQTWGQPGDSTVHMYTGLPWRLDAMFLGSLGGFPLTAGAGYQQGTVVPPVAPLASLPPLPALEPTPDCFELGLVLDPNAATDGLGLPSWQEHVTVRAAWPAHGHGALAFALEQEVDALATATVLHGPVDHPDAEFAFTPPAAGTYRLGLSWDGGACLTRFQMTPNDAPSGSLAFEASVAGDTATLSFEPAAADGAPLGHYEFHTTVLRTATDDDPGMLVWSGKLHEHSGAASITFAGLAAGTYRAWTYPGPQDADAPPILPDGADGFVRMFTVAAATEGEGPASQESSAVPAVAVALALAALVLHRRPKP